MSLRKSPIRTAALLAACRANAQKSSGPRTPEGKARSRLNSLRHGRSCRKLHRSLPEGLCLRDRVTYQWIQDVIETCFPPRTPRERDGTRRLAVEVWCQVAGTVGRSVSGNLAETRRVREKYSPFLSPSQFRITVPHSKQSLTFWTRAVGRRARPKLGQARRRRAQGLFAGWYGRMMQDWGRGRTLDIEKDPMARWYWERECKRRERALRRAQMREARQVRKWRAVLDDIYLGCLGTPANAGAPFEHGKDGGLMRLPEAAVTARSQPPLTSAPSSAKLEPSISGEGSL